MYFNDRWWFIWWRVRCFGSRSYGTIHRAISWTACRRGNGTIVALRGTPIYIKTNRVRCAIDEFRCSLFCFIFFFSSCLERIQWQCICNYLYLQVYQSAVRVWPWPYIIGGGGSEVRYIIWSKFQTQYHCQERDVYTHTFFTFIFHTESVKFVDFAWLEHISFQHIWHGHDILTLSNIILLLKPQLLIIV